MGYIAPMKLILVAITFLGVSVLARAEQATYAGVSYSPSTGQIAVGKSESGFKDSFRRANAACRYNDCRVPVGVKSGWLAVFHSKVFRQFGFAADPVKSKAIERAREACEKTAGHSCELKNVVCSWKDCDEPNPFPSAQQPVPKEKLYASMAFSMSSKSLGVCNNVDDWGKAVDCALDDCGRGDCNIGAVASFCAAFVTRDAFVDAKGVSRPRSYCFSNGFTPEGAEGYAQAICEQHGNFSRVERTVCTRNYQR